MTIDFSKQNNIYEKKALVYALYERFNQTFGNYVDLNIVKEGLNNVEKMTKDVGLGISAYQEDDKIYVKDDVDINTFFHEVLHYVTREHNGMAYSLVGAYSDEEFDNCCREFGQDRFVKQIAMLDESFTTFITELAIPETDYTNLYEFGTNFLRKYYSALINNGIDTSFLFTMYFNEDPVIGLKFKESFGSKFKELIDTIEKSNNAQYIGKIIREQRKNPSLTADDIIGKKLTEEEIDNLIEESINNMKTRS
ncbi:MAG: hypothetical protein IKX00_02425 [Bacilli bacterium]|nr:hypothetical protein [Bacilli bacterium]